MDVLENNESLVISVSNPESWIVQPTAYLLYRISYPDFPCYRKQFKSPSFYQQQVAITVVVYGFP